MVCQAAGPGGGWGPALRGGRPVSTRGRERGKPVRPAFWVPTCPLPLAQPIGDHQEPPGLRRLTPTQGLTSHLSTLEPIPKEEPLVQRPPQSRSPLPHASAPAPEAPAGLMPGSGPQSHPLLRKPLWAVPTSHAPPESPPPCSPAFSLGNTPEGPQPPSKAASPWPRILPKPGSPQADPGGPAGSQTHCSEAPMRPQACGDGGLPPWPPLTPRPPFYLLLC